MRRLYREVGGRVIAYVAVARVLPERVGRVEWFTVMEYPIERDVPLDDLHYRWAGREDVGLLTAFGLTAPEVEARIAVGDRARLCLDARGALLAYAWYRFHAWDEEGVEFILGPRDAWGYDFDVAPTVRGRRLLGHIGFEGSAALAEEGITRILGGVDVANRGVYRAFRRRRATSMGTIAMLRIGDLSLRRERWGDEVTRWRLYRGRCPVGLPELGAAPAVWEAEIAAGAARP